MDSRITSEPPPRPIPTVGRARHIAQNLYRIAQRAGLQTSPSVSATTSRQGVSNKIRIVCISDTHNHKPELPTGDVLLHAGDMTDGGTYRELQAQLDWLNSLPHKHKVVIGGNHDGLLDEDFIEAHPEKEQGRHDKIAGRTKADLNWGDVVYLQNSAATIQVEAGDDEKGVAQTRNLKIYGNPGTIRCGPFGFSLEPELANYYWEDRIPSDTDIVLCHSPPRYHMDAGFGCSSLLEEIWRVKPPLMVFGHAHVDHGEGIMKYDAVQYWYERVMTTGSWGSLTMLAIHVFFSRVRGIFVSRRPLPRGQATHLVNAAMKSGNDWFKVIEVDF